MRRGYELPLAYGGSRAVGKMTLIVPSNDETNSALNCKPHFVGQELANLLTGDGPARGHFEFQP